MPSRKRLIEFGEVPEFEEKIGGKGTWISIFPEYVIKSYALEPTLLSPEEQHARFMREVQAYQLFAELKCPYVPALIDHSDEERWLCIQRVAGSSVIALCESNSVDLQPEEFIPRLSALGEWLAAHDIVVPGANIKDLILDKNGKLYLVDFEEFRSGVPADPIAIYESVIGDIVERIFVRKGRSARLTLTFLRLAWALLACSPGIYARSFKTRVIGYYRNRLRILQSRIKRIILGPN